MPNYIQPEEYGTFEEGGVGGGEEFLEGLMTDYGWGPSEASSAVGSWSFQGQDTGPATEYRSFEEVESAYSGSGDIVSLSPSILRTDWQDREPGDSYRHWYEKQAFYEFDEKTQQGIDRLLSSMQEYDTFQEDLATSSAISDINVGESMIRSTANEAISAMGQTVEGLGRSGLAGSGAGRELLENFRDTYGEKVGGMTSGLRQTGIVHKSDVAQSRQQYRDDIWNLFSKWVQGDPEQAKKDWAYIYHPEVEEESEDTGGGFYG